MDQPQEHHEHHEHHHEHEPHHGHHHPVDVRINQTPVRLTNNRLNGLQIKEQAIKAGLQIDVEFQLQMKTAAGPFKIVGNDDAVHIHEHAEFTAIAPHDHS